MQLFMRLQVITSNLYNLQEDSEMQLAQERDTTLYFSEYEKIFNYF